jgi:molybdenum-dependent DNA-binding transcriptional regulator ModE
MEEDLKRYLPESFEYLIQDALIESFNKRYNQKESKLGPKAKELLAYYKREKSNLKCYFQVEIEDFMKKFSEKLKSDVLYTIIQTLKKHALIIDIF